VGSIDEGKSFSFLISIHWNDESDGMWHKTGMKGATNCFSEPQN
jgi:hypothetical protein